MSAKESEPGRYNGTVMTATALLLSGCAATGITMYGSNHTITNEQGSTVVQFDQETAQKGYLASGVLLVSGLVMTGLAIGRKPEN